MKNRLAVLTSVLGMSAFALMLNVAQAQAVKTCKATCPTNYTQVSGSCPVVSSQCAAQCTGQIVCVSTTGAQINRPCQCVTQ